MTYTYDDDGNMTSKTEDSVTTTYTWDAENRLIAVSIPGDSWSYSYDGFGTRVAATDNGESTDYVVDPIGYGNVAAEYDGAGQLAASYTHGYGLLSQDRGEVYYYTFDAIGSTSEVTDPILGTTVNSYRYDPFGIHLASNETVSNAFEYVGEYGIMQEPTEMAFMRARYYDAALGRFITRDPIGLQGNDVNLYRYAGNSPATLVDPTGTLGVCDVTTNVGFIIERTGELIGKVKIGSLIGMGVGGVLSVGGMLTLNPVVFGWGASITYWSTKTYVVFETLDLSHPGSPNVFEEIGSKIKSYCLPKQVKAAKPNTDPRGHGGGSIRDMRDPNDKLAPAGAGTGHYLQADKTLTYTVRFENIETADAPAHIVRVTDVLDDDLELSTLELTEIGFANEIISIPAGHREYHGQHTISVDNEYTTGQLVVQIDVTLDPTTREMEMVLTGVDPLTGWLPEDFLLGFLYPNDDTGRGDGYLSYMIEPLADLPSGTRIENKARIFFDWNDPIDTPLVFNTLDAGRPSSQVDPLPAIVDVPEFAVIWSGSDDAGGSGIATYDIYISDNGGPWTLWQDDTELTEATFNGESGHTYAFYSRAMDGVGHQEDAPTTADATASVNTPPTVDAGEDTGSATEGTAFVRSSLITDGDAGDSWTATVDYGDGSGEQPLTLTGQNFELSHVYADNGDYMVVVTVTDSFGGIGTAEIAVNVADAVPTIGSIATSGELAEGQSVDFSAVVTSPSDDIVLYEWDFDGLGSSTEIAPSFTFADDGTYNVTLTVTDDDGSTDTLTVPVVIADTSPQIVSMQASGTADEANPLTFSATVNAPVDAIVQWEWDFDGLGSSPEQSPSFAFPDNGTYTVTLTVTDEDGSTDSDTLEVTVANAAPTINSLTGDTVVDQGHPASFTASASDPAGAADPLTYTWDFGDGSDPVSGVDLRAVDHSYEDFGDYTVTLTVTDGDGGQDQAIHQLLVEAGPAAIVARHAFLNNSSLDGGTSGASSQDDNAIADAVALMPGETGSGANVTSYANGLNGIMVDIDGLADPGGLNLSTIGDYFGFKVGTDDNPDGWAAAPAPVEVDVRSVGGSDRVTLIWADGAIRNQWLQVTVKSGAVTGLDQDDVFYFGNMAGDSTGDGTVNAFDLLMVRQNYLKPSGPDRDDAADVTGDGMVNAFDLLTVRQNYLEGLALITPTAAVPPAAMMSVASPSLTSLEVEPAGPAAAAQITLTFSQDVGILPTALELTDPLGSPVDSSGFTFAYDPERFQARWEVPMSLEGVYQGVLPADTASQSDPVRFQFHWRGGLIEDVQQDPGEGMVDLLQLAAM